MIPQPSQQIQMLICSILMIAWRFTNDTTGPDTQFNHQEMQIVKQLSFDILNLYLGLSMVIHVHVYPTDGS